MLPLTRNFPLVPLFYAKPTLAISVARGKEQGPGPSPIEMLLMKKMSRKRLLLLQFQFLLASSRTTVYAYSSN